MQVIGHQAKNEKRHYGKEAAITQSDLVQALLKHQLFA